MGDTATATAPSSGRGSNRSGTNHRVAVRLREIGARLEEQRANPFRVRAYRNAADRVDGLADTLEEVLARGGRQALVALADIGEGLAATIEELVHSGRSGLADRIDGADDPVSLIQCLPGIGPELALRIYDALKIETLEDLEAAAYDGRLDAVPGIGARRMDGIRNALTVLLQMRGSLRPDGQRAQTSASVEEILDVDAEYRRKAADDTLVRIAPRRFNPEHVRWLPIMHTHREDRHYTALFSNTARAHQLQRTRDWVIVYFYDNEHREARATVVTETRGLLQGQRVVRGREQECAELAGLTEQAGEPA